MSTGRAARSRPRISLVATRAIAAFIEYAELAAMLATAGVEVEVVGPGAPELSWAPGVAGRDLPAGTGPIARAAMIPVLSAHWLETEPDIVHALDDDAHSVVLAAAKAARVPYVVWSVLERLGGDRTPGGFLSSRLSAFRKKAWAEVDAFIAMNAAVRDALAERSGMPRRWTLLDSGMGAVVEDLVRDGDDGAVQDKARALLGLSDAHQIVGVVLDEPEPSDLEAVNAFIRQMKRRSAGTRIAVALGSGTLRASALERDARVQVYDGLESLVPFYESLDLLVMPCAGRSAVRAMEAGAARIPCVAVASPWVRPVVRGGVSGELVTADAEALVEAVRRWLADGELRRSAGAHARSYGMRLFDRELAVRKVLAVYDELLSGGEPLHLTGDGQLVGESSLNLADAEARRRRDLLGG